MNSELEKRAQQQVGNTAAEQINDSGEAYSPDVDIFATPDELVFGVDLPGVEKGAVAIEINENNTLVIRAKNSFKEPDNPVFRQYRVGNYFRAFQIGDEYDKGKISARIENGLLEIRVPKREEVKPRTIEISA